MFTKSYTNAEINRGLKFHKILGGFALKAYAEENESEKGTDPTLSVNFERLIAQARKDEKDKLYPRISKLEEDNKALTESCNGYLLQIGALKDEIDRLKSADSEEVQKMRATITDLQGQVRTLTENAVDEKSIREKVAAEYEVKMYAQQQIAQHNGSILSTLVSSITGTTKEEVDNAVKEALETTEAIKKELGLPVDGEGGSSSKKGKKTSTPAKRVPPASPSTETEEEDYDADYIRSLDPRSKEYAEFRKKMGLR